MAKCNDFAVQEELAFSKKTGISELFGETTAGETDMDNGPLDEFKFLDSDVEELAVDPRKVMFEANDFSADSKSACEESGSDEGSVYEPEEEEPKSKKQRQKSCLL